MTGTVLILGASGTFGSAAAQAFTKGGWQVRRYARGTDMTEAAKGADLIINALNPQGYKNWDTEIPRITSQVLTAARHSGATVLVPGNVYNFGTQGGTWSAETPQRTTTRKGRTRIAMETAYRDAAAQGVRTIILRAGDFMSPDGKSSWLRQAIGRDAAKGKLAYPGNPDIPHAWAYTPDLARAALALADIRSQLPAFADIPFPGHTFTGRQMAAELEQATGRTFKLGRFPWWMMTLLSPFMSFAREVQEMRYLWDIPHSLDGSAFDALVPDFEPTPLGTALTHCLDLEPSRPLPMQTIAV